MSKNWVQMYTDGSCEPNPGTGGWAVVFVMGQHEKAISGGASDTTNNRMEMTAAIEGLNYLKRPCRVSIYTDSQYLQMGITRWLRSWKRRGWRGANKKPIKNQDLWQALNKAIQRHDDVIWNWIPGHQGHRYNEQADQLSNYARQRFAQEIHDAAS